MSTVWQNKGLSLSVTVFKALLQSRQSSGSALEPEDCFALQCLPDCGPGNGKSRTPQPGRHTCYMLLKNWKPG